MIKVYWKENAYYQFESLSYLKQCSKKKEKGKCKDKKYLHIYVYKIIFNQCEESWTSVNRQIINGK